jgi:hypothetical protein
MAFRAAAAVGTARRGPQDRPAQMEMVVISSPPEEVVAAAVPARPVAVKVAQGVLVGLVAVRVAVAEMEALERDPMASSDQTAALVAVPAEVVVAAAMQGMVHRGRSPPIPPVGRAATVEKGVATAILGAEVAEAAQAAMAQSSQETSTTHSRYRAAQAVPAVLVAMLPLLLLPASLTVEMAATAVPAASDCRLSVVASH